MNCNFLNMRVGWDAERRAPHRRVSASKTSYMEIKYTDKEEEYINKLMAEGMDRKEAERFLAVMQTVAPGDFNKGLGCIRRTPRWMK